MGFSVTKLINGEDSMCTKGMTIGFAAASPAQAVPGMQPASLLAASSAA